MAATRTFPGLTNELGGKTQAAWEGLQSYGNHMLTIWGANDPNELGLIATQNILLDGVPGTKGQPHVRLDEASHFLQDDQGVEISTRMVEVMRNNPIK